VIVVFQLGSTVTPEASPGERKKGGVSSELVTNCIKVENCRALRFELSKHSRGLDHFDMAMKVYGKAVACCSHQYIAASVFPDMIGLLVEQKKKTSVEATRF